MDLTYLKSTKGANNAEFSTARCRLPVMQSYAVRYCAQVTSACLHTAWADVASCYNLLVRQTHHVALGASFIIIL